MAGQPTPWTSRWQLALLCAALTSTGCSSETLFGVASLSITTTSADQDHTNAGVTEIASVTEEIEPAPVEPTPMAHIDHQPSAPTSIQRQPSPTPVADARQTESAPDLKRWTPEHTTADWQYIVLHHTATGCGSVESIHKTHRARRDRHGNPWRGIGYHFVIGNGNGMSDGGIEPTFRWKEQSPGAHAGSSTYNVHGIGICLVGNFEEAPPSPAQLAATKRLIAALADAYGIDADHIIGHHDIKPTACPGRHFPIDVFTEITLSQTTRKTRQ